MKIAVFLSILITISNAALPTVIFHGLLDSCHGWGNLAKRLTLQTGVYFECIEIGNGHWTTVMTPIESQA